MDDIFVKIDEMFENENVAKGILNELRNIKFVLTSGREFQKEEKRKLNKAYYKFYYEFRERMKERPREGYFPEFEIDGKTYAINKNGLLYEKTSNKVLPKSEAFKIYEKIFYEGYFIM
ncbi:MAG: hypothetical protein ABGX26_01060 [Nautiliaceae bacterium]